jgi:nicotinic acid mononucleotide adenylyltransferase
VEALVDRLDPDAEPEAHLVRAAGLSGPIGLLPGSFNPPTDAHVALARAGRAAGLGCVYYLLSKHTVDKEGVAGIPLADRLELLSRIAAESGDGVAFANRGLYVDLARAMRRALPAARLVFLVGHDKIVQVFDRRYYAAAGGRPDAALEELFSLATFLVAPRADADGDDLAALLAEPENRRFARQVGRLALADRHRHVSSTRIRRGESGEVPPAVAEYLKRQRPFAP